MVNPQGYFNKLVLKVKVSNSWMNFKFLVIINLTFLCNSYGQMIYVDTYKHDGYEVSISKEVLEKLTNGCESIHNTFSFYNGDKLIFEEVICTPEIDDLSIVRSGYLTVVQYYSSPVGWSKYFVFDFCKGRMDETLRLEEMIEIDWDLYLSMRESDYSEYLEKSTTF